MRALGYCAEILPYRMSRAILFPQYGLFTLLIFLFVIEDIKPSTMHLCCCLYKILTYLVDMIGAPQPLTLRIA